MSLKKYLEPLMLSCNELKRAVCLRIFCCHVVISKDSKDSILDLDKFYLCFRDNLTRFCKDKLNL